MRKGLKALGAAIAAVALFMVGGVGSASAACTADSSSGPDARTGTQIPPGGTALGTVYLDPTAGSGSIGGFLGYAEFKASTTSASGELNGTGVGYIESDAQVSGTTVSSGTDGSTSNGAVSGSGELSGTTLSDVQLNGICATP